MTQLNSKRWLIAMFILTPLLALSGCGSKADDATATAAPPPTAVSVDNANDTPEATPLPVDIVYGPGSFDLPAPNIGLADLSSYRATLTISFKGTKTGQPVEWLRTYVMLANQNPTARQFTMEKAGDPAAALFMLEMNGALYERQAEGPCIASVINNIHSLAGEWEPAAFLSGVFGAEAAGNETMNSVATAHYTFDERALAHQDVTQSTGAFWIAADGGYLVKYSLVTKGNADYFGNEAEGAITWDYTLTDVNQPIAIPLPEDCPSGMVDTSSLPNATDMVKLPGILRYNTITNLADVAAFYQKELLDQGWQLPTAPTIDKDSASLNFTKGDQQLTVTITAGDGKTKVRIYLEAVP